MIRKITSCFLIPAMTALIFAKCRSEVRDGMIVFTRSSGDLSQLVAVNPRNTGRPAEILTGRFFSAKDPEISFDGKWLVFSAIEKENEPWQIWKLRLRDLQATRVTFSPVSCSEPAWLPGNQIVFSSENGTQPGKALFTCSDDGSGITRITFDPYEYSSTVVLKDGRILAVRRQRDGLNVDEMIAVLRPDGTKTGIFYKSPDGTTPENLGREDMDGNIYLIESTVNSNGGELVSINYNRPLISREDHTSASEGSFRSVFPTGTGKLYVSYRFPGKGKYMIGEFDPVQLRITRTVFESNEWDAFDPVTVARTVRPRKLPSEVDTGVKTGLLLCQDVNFTGIQPKFTSFVPADAGKIEIIGADSSMGVTNVEKDGSFYLKVIADTPFRIQKIDGGGRILSGPSAWMYLRPNERRGCVGCHEDPQIVPENKLPDAVRKEPVSIPVQISGIKEKEILLE